MAGLTNDGTSVRTVGCAGSPVRAFLCGEATVEVETGKSASDTVLGGFLKETGDPIGLPSVKRFAVRDKLRIDVNSELPIIYLDSELRIGFPDLVEENVPAMTVRQHRLLRSSMDRSILADLGDRNFPEIRKARVSFAHVFEFLKVADRSKDFIFYVENARGLAYAINAFWFRKGWNIKASPVSYPRVWCPGNYIISH